MSVSVALHIRPSNEDCKLNMLISDFRVVWARESKYLFGAGLSRLGVRTKTSLLG